MNKHQLLPPPPPPPPNRIILTPTQQELNQHGITSTQPNWLTPNLISKIPNQFRNIIKKHFTLDNSFDPPPPKPFKQRLKDPSKKKPQPPQFINLNKNHSNKLYTTAWTPPN